jgi:hypothetical protein
MVIADLEYCSAPQFYYRIGVLVGYILSAIFWLTGWAWAASWAAYILSFDNYDSYDNIRGAWKLFGQTIAACAGISALIWVLCIITLVVFCRACVRSSGPSLARNTELGNPLKLHEAQNQMMAPSVKGYASQPVYEGQPSQSTF